MLSANGLYGHIRNNALKSAFLLTGFVVLMVVFWYSWCIIYTAIADVWWANFAQRRPRNPATVADILSKALELALNRWWLPLVLSAIWFAIAYAMHADMIKAATGAQTITRIEAPKLYNLVENLSISAGLPMPRVQVIRTDALNAYATGLGPKDATIVVTSGLLRSLTEDELEAVLAHEMTHIKNYDVRLMVIATCFAGGLTLVGDGISRMCSDSSDSSVDLAVAGNEILKGGLKGGGRDGDTSAVIISVLISLAIAIVFLALTHLFALLVNFAISRAREFMADAGAVELTKNPDALISALNKISGNDEIPGLSKNLRAMMISSSVNSLFSTHPSMSTRIMALQQYAGGRVMDRPKRATRVGTEVRGSQAAVAGPAGAMGFAGGRASFGKRKAITA